MLAPYLFAWFGWQRGAWRRVVVTVACWIAPLLGLVFPLQAHPPAAPTHPPAAEKAAQEAQDPISDGWVRLVKDPQGKPLAMQTAIGRYQSTPAAGEQPVTVDLIGAVHVGDAAYYAQLNRQFRHYDALLYELVAPEGTVIQPGQKSSNRHLLGILQNGMKSVLELEHQLEKIDYTAENFVHADMSPEEFFASMRQRKESLLQMYFRLVGQAMSQQQQQASDAVSQADLFRALFAEDRARQLKIVMARQFSNMESLLTAFAGEEGSTLITERNKVALEVLQEQIDAGKSQLGIFYGAGHLDDMDKRLRQELGFQPVGVTWVTAWNLSTGNQ